MAKLSKEKRDDFKCEACNDFSSFLLAELNKPKAKTEIIYGLQDLICKELPKPFYKTVC